MTDDELVTDADWINEISIEELPESHRALAEAAGGLRPALKISEAWGGEYRYIAKMDKLLRVLRDRKIRREFTGLNHRELVRKYKLSETWIRKIVETPEPEDRQVPLFPDADAPLPP